MEAPTEAVRVVRIDQPHARNAVNSATAARLHDEFVAFDADEDAKVAILTGDDIAFCAGANLRDLPDLRPSGPLGPTRLAPRQAGDRGDRRMVRGRRRRARGVV